MQEDLQLCRKRFEELSDRSVKQDRFTFTEFLTMAEQDTLLKMRLSAKAELWGGFDEAERRIARFGITDEIGYEEEFPLNCLKAEPVSEKFGEELSHRDYLGALMSLGIRREVLGDIVTVGKSAYIFCLSSMSDYICENLTSIKHTTVKCSVTDELPSAAAPKPEKSSVVAASARADAVAAAVWGLSRGDSSRLFEQKKVYINSRLTENSTKQLMPGDTVSCRGFGRFIFEGAENETRHGRMRIGVRIYK